MGEFFDPTPKTVHRCDLPPASGFARGGWRCECGKAFLLEALPDRDVNPGESPYQWRRASEHDEPSPGWVQQR